MSDQKLIIGYYRLSMEDDSEGESNSIINQKKMLEDYAKANGFTNCVHFTDDGWSGGSFDRPSWKRMIEGIEKGEIACQILWDYNALGYRDQFVKNNPDAKYDVVIPSDGSVQSGYTTIINAYTKRPYAAALTREYILSDEGQINLARGYATPIRKNVKLPEDVKAKMLPESQYTKARPIKDFTAWGETVKKIPTLWQEEVMAFTK